MRMSYAGAGYPLSMLVRLQGSHCDMRSHHVRSGGSPRVTFETRKQFWKIILKSSWLRDALSELDRHARNSQLQAIPLHLPGGLLERQYNPDYDSKLRGHSEVLRWITPATRRCSRHVSARNTVSFSYRFSHISKTLRALQSSSKTSLRINEEGLLSLQFLMPSPKSRAGGGGGASAFIEFRCLALDEGT
ncbi:Rad1/Rec1/Rad17 [Sparassis latifolia]